MKEHLTDRSLPRPGKGNGVPAWRARSFKQMATFWLTSSRAGQSIYPRMSNNHPLNSIWKDRLAGIPAHFCAVHSLTKRDPMERPYKQTPHTYERLAVGPILHFAQLVISLSGFLPRLENSTKISPLFPPTEQANH